MIDAAYCERYVKCQSSDAGGLRARKADIGAMGGASISETNPRNVLKVSIRPSPTMQRFVSCPNHFKNENFY
jgi:hypothetical protein